MQSKAEIRPLSQVKLAELIFSLFAFGVIQLWLRIR
jgi:hypothetical protein